MTAAPVLQERLYGHARFRLAKRNHSYPELLHNGFDLGRGLRLCPSHIYQARFDESRRTDANLAGLENPIDEIKAARFAEDHGDKGRGIERHTPPGPKPRISSSSARDRR